MSIVQQRVQPVTNSLHWAGVVSRDGSAPEALLERAVGPGARSSVLVWRTDHGAAAFLAQPRRSDVSVARLEDVLVALDGRLDNRFELAQSIGLSRAVPLPQLLARLYSEHGPELPAQLLGDFSFALFDATRATLLLARDAIGLRPLYYAESGGSIVFSSTLALLRRALTRTPTPRANAIAQLLIRPETLSAGETCLAGVHALPPAHVLISTGIETRLRQYWEAQGSEHADLDFAGCAESFDALFRQSVQRRLAGARSVSILVQPEAPAAALYATARAQGGHVIGLAHVNEEAAAAAEQLDLLEQGGRSIQRLPVLPSGYPDLVDVSVRESEAPLADACPALSVRISEALRTTGAQLLLSDAWANDVLFPFPPGYFIDQLRELKWPTLLQHLRAFPAWLPDLPEAALRKTVWQHLVRAHLPGVLRQGVSQLRQPAGLVRLFERDLRSSLQTRAAAQVRFARSASAHGRAVENSFRSRASTMRLEWSAKSAAMNARQIALPYLDRDLLALLVTAPGEVQTDAGVPLALLRRGMKEQIPPPFLAPRTTAERDRHHAAVLAAGCDDVFERLRAGRALEYGFLDPAAFSENVAHLCAHARLTREEAAQALASLYAVECWLHQFA